ncbi:MULTISPECIES: hypothetical protein [unclassified Sphingobium]|uniref:hypothetical protein n=1 Tax=unclassified Sphingobium TaxID=2611147 RepID=UPI0022252A4B|nr:MULTISPECIES: hypothetical protein [unclassified Sphingobium]MCW2395872.1 hypothetical protein [Sphingobium sp. B8D3B]MCW2419388.1 hypothetical protein [Sphingobium sp. B8D3C]
MTLTPSAMSKWEGTPVAGSRFTAQQHYAMADARPGWVRMPAHIVKLTYPSVLQWGEPTIVLAPCPIIARTRDGTRRLIVTPSGEKMWVATSTDQGDASA